MTRSSTSKAGVVAFISAASAVAVILNLAWFGVYTFVNAFLADTLGLTDAEWTEATLWPCPTALCQEK